MSNWIYVNVMSRGGANKEGANALRSCANLVSFIAAVGVTYQVIQSVPVFNHSRLQTVRSSTRWNRG